MRNKFIIVDFSLAILFIIYFFYIFVGTTSNIPINDDYSVLDNFTDIVNADSFFEKIKLFFKQHNEHRILYDKLWFFIDYKLSQQVNFNHLSLIGNLSLLGIFIFFLLKFKEKAENTIYLFPLAVLIFNFSFHENLTFAMANLSNFTVVLFSLLSLHFITKPNITKKNFILTILFLILAIFTQGAGLFLILILSVILFLNKEKKYLFQFLIISAILIVIYFIDYQKPPNSPEIIETLRSFKFRSFLFSFSFLGNIFAKNLIFTNDINESLMISTGVGFLFFVFYLYLIKIKYFRKNLFVFSVMSLFILISFVTGITRSQLGIDMSIASRYRINSCIFLICMIFFFIENTPKTKINLWYLNSVLLVFTTGYFFAMSFPQQEYLEFRKKQNYYGVLSYYNRNHKNLNGFEQDYYKNVLLKANASETYFLPTEDLVNKEINYSNKIDVDLNNYESNSVSGNIDKIEKLQNSVYIEGWAFIDSLNTKDQEITLAIEDTIQNRKIFFKGQKFKRYDLNPYFKKANLESAGCIFRIKNQDLPVNYNKLYLLVDNKGKKRIFNSKKITQ
ncbi:hypothetical protein [Flavobacterium sp.]|jgi:hypothetical protein|uniref:hypothetical protein n=1 Tax=Flavobacterium sp. TaxID=239 RepID=UPI0037BFF802